MNFDKDAFFIIPSFKNGSRSLIIRVLHPNKSITDLSGPEKPACENKDFIGLVEDLIALIDSLVDQGRISQVVADDLKVDANKLIETDDVVINGVETQ